MKNPKQKGNNFESFVAKKISMFFSNGERDDLFERSNNSGAKHTVRRKKGKSTINQHGDIVSTCPETSFFTDKFFVECKHTKDINLWSLITNIKGESVYGWLTELEEKCDIENKRPLLIAKQNMKPVLVFCDHHIWEDCISNDIFSGYFFKTDKWYIFKFEYMRDINFNELNERI
jgi:hypothetical protein